MFIVLVHLNLCCTLQDQIMGFISSIFLRKLLCPGVFHDVALRLTLRDHNKHWTDSEFQSLSLDELKSEILLLVEQEVWFLHSSRVPCRYNALDCSLA